MKTILICDDDPTMVELMSAVLLDAGYAVIAAEKASDVIIRFGKGEDIDLVLLDAKLPGLDGPSLRRTLRQINPRMPVAYVTGLDGQPDPTNGHTLTLFKPFSISALLRLVEKLIGQP